MAEFVQSSWGHPITRCLTDPVTIVLGSGEIYRMVAIQGPCSLPPGPRYAKERQPACLSLTAFTCVTTPQQSRSDNWVIGSSISPRYPASPADDPLSESQCLIRMDYQSGYNAGPLTNTQSPQTPFFTTGPHTQPFSAPVAASPGPPQPSHLSGPNRFGGGNLPMGLPAGNISNGMMQPGFQQFGGEW